MTSHWRKLREMAAASRDRFMLATRNPARAQLWLLREIVKRNAATRFGRAHGFEAITSAEDFRARVPVRHPDAFLEDIAEMVAGKENILTHEPVVAFDITSGTTAPSKIVPYTASSLRAFREALLTWLADMLDAHPGIMRGRFYWALSPIMKKATRTASGVPVGAVSDAVFFGEEALDHLAALSVVPDTLVTERSLRRWRVRTLCHLLNAADLTLISIWSPVFLTALIEELLARPQPVLRALATGAEGCPHNPKLAERLEKMLEAGGFDATTIWPELQLTSCWADAGARRFVPALERLLPHAPVQGKGLMSTEAMISIPLSGAAWPVPALTSTFLEFRAPSGDILLVHELAPDEEYTVIVTTFGGLYRLDTGDVVKVHDFTGSVPQLEFMGRANLTSDMCGEKLSEDFVLSCLEGLEAFVLVVPVSVPAPHYVLVLDERETNEHAARQLEERLENAFHANPHYAHARGIGQLGALRALRVECPMRRLQALLERDAPKASTAKPPVLSTREDWHILLREWGKS